MQKDIRELLDEWAFDSQNNIRVVEGRNGRLILQVRLPVGLEQYELDGRPDGLRPEGKDSWLEVIAGRIARREAEGGSYELSADEFLQLQNEGILFYYRYMLLFQMNDFVRVLHDTDHNLQASTLIERHCSDEENRSSVLQFRPYVIRMNAMARSMLSLQQSDFAECVRILERAIEKIEAMDAVPSPAFQFEKSRSLTYLRTALEQLVERQPDEKAKLEAELEEAVATEDYEHAAQLRDEIKRLIDKAKSA
jgi:DNA-binding XRE family transcriptional regulator